MNENRWKIFKIIVPFSIFCPIFHRKLAFCEWKILFANGAKWAGKQCTNKFEFDCYSSPNSNLKNGKQATKVHLFCANFMTNNSHRRGKRRELKCTQNNANCKWNLCSDEFKMAGDGIPFGIEKWRENSLIEFLN